MLKKKIMIVDDDQGVLEVTKIIVENAGYEVETFSSGSHLYSIEKNLPDLIIMDIMLSGEDGRDICKYLKTQVATKDIPIILFSANNVGNEAMFNNCHPNRFISKPYDIGEIKNTIRELLSSENGKLKTKND